MMIEKKAKRAKAGPALGNIQETKIVVDAMIERQTQETRAKTDRLRAVRLQHETARIALNEDC